MKLMGLKSGVVGVACAMVVGMGANSVAAVSTALLGGVQQIAYFDNDLYTDVDGESVNLAASLTAQGHTLNSFSGITAADWNAATAVADLLVIPELDNGDLFAALDAAAISAINSYIGNGGGLIMFDRTVSAPRTIDFLNGIFGYALQPGFIVASQSLNAAAAAGTEFEGGPPALPDISATEGLTTASLPPGSLSLYEQGANTSVLAVDQGSGRIVFLGFDWFEVPTPAEWEDVLGRGVNHVAAGAAGQCLTDISLEIVCHADGTTFTVNIEGLNACTGGTTQFTFTASGGAIGEEMCFTLLVDDGGFCCTTEICVTIPDCTGGTGALEILTINTGDSWANSTISAIPGHNVTTITAAGIGGIDFTLFDVLYVTDAFSNPSTPIWASELIARAPDIDTYINGGGFVIVGVEAFGGDSITNGDEYNFLPSGLVDGQTVGTLVFGDDVVITDPTHPLFDGITSADLSNWGVSYHGSLPVGTLPVLATNAGGQVLIRGGSVGAGGVFVWSLDPDFHFDIPGTLALVENAIGLVQAAQPVIPSDLNGDGLVGIVDFLTLLAAWGSCSDCSTCPADFDGDCNVGINDLLILLGKWG